MTKRRTKRTRKQESYKSLKRTRKQESHDARKRIQNILGVEAVEGHHLVWRFSISDRGGPFSWDSITENDRKAVWIRLGEFERMTIRQLKEAKSHHIVPQSRLSVDAKDRLRQLKLDDIDELCSFRVTGERRLWCIKHENIYALLWWDPKHKVYPVSKKRT